MSDVTLTDRTNKLLTHFTQHSFKAHDLRAAVPLKSPRHVTHNGASDNTENLTRFTQQQQTGFDATTANMTGVSDGGLVMDPEDRDRAAEDLKDYKDFVSTLKFAYLESNIKLQFVAHVTDKDGLRPISLEDNDRLEKERLQTKAELRDKKRRAIELELAIRAEADRLDARLQKSEQDAMRAANLLTECEAMEMEIAMLKNKRSAAERITIDESLALQDDQLFKMAQIGPKTTAAMERIAATKASIKSSKSMIEKLEVHKREMRREQEDREVKGTRDERAEEGCRWFTNATALYSSLLGIRSAYATGPPGLPPTSLVVEYDRTAGDTRTLRIDLDQDGGGRMIGAELVNSSEDIQDIVDAYLPSQDMRSLVQEVRARVVH